MNRTQHRLPRLGLTSALVGALVACGVTLAVAIPLLSKPPVATVSEAETTSPADVVDRRVPSSVVSTGCTAAGMVEPGQYESIEHRATWVVVPESYKQIAPAPLYVVSVIDFSGTTTELDLVLPAVGALDGVVMVTAVEAVDAEYVALLDEVLLDFCIDDQRVVNIMLPMPGSDDSPEPPPPPPGDRVFA